MITYDHSPETLTDRCSAEVSFPPVYNGQANDPSAIVLRRGTNGYSDWTPIFQVGLNDDHFVRWYCHSTSGNFLDPGTWRLRDNGVGCQFSGSGGTISDPSKAGGSNLTCTSTVNLVSNDSVGWTAERSRCNDHTNKFRARLGPNRLLEILCVESVIGTP